MHVSCALQDPAFDDESCHKTERLHCVRADDCDWSRADPESTDSDEGESELRAQETIESDGEAEPTATTTEDAGTAAHGVCLRVSECVWMCLGVWGPKTY